MEYRKFCESVLSELKRMLGDEYTVRIENILKNNQVSYDAVIIMKKGTTIAPSVYMDDYFDAYKAGMNVTDIALSIIVRYEKYKDGISIDLDMLMKYEHIKDKIFVKAINADLNEKLLTGMPHVNYFDLAMVAYAVLEDNGTTRITMNVTNGNLDVWNISSEILFKNAINNTRKKLPPRFDKMSDVMKELLAAKVMRCGYRIGEDEEMDRLLAQTVRAIEESDDGLMFVLTSERKLDGAVYILFSDVLEEIADMLQNDIYIIPSSIHEIMILPRVDGVDYNELRELVNSVNYQDMDQLEILSDNVYIYERGRGIAWERGR